MDEVPADIAARLVRALDRSPSTVVGLMGTDMKTSWVSRSLAWVTGADPDDLTGQEAFELVHPDDVEPLLHGLAQSLAASQSDPPNMRVVDPVRYRVLCSDGNWMTMESVVLNLYDDPVVQGVVSIGRPIDGELDGIGFVVDLLVAEAPLPQVLTACARLVPDYLGSAAVVALVDGGPVIGAPADSPAERLVSDDRWWRPAITDGQARTPLSFAGLPDDLAEEARRESFSSVWVLPVSGASAGEVVGCVVVWVRLHVELNVANDRGVRQAERLARLVIGEQRRHHALHREALTDPLTRVANRSALRRRFDAATGPVTVAVLDLDDFKPVNDTYGHDVGDAVLQVVAKRIVEVVREDDLVVRLGGDEFAVVFAEGTSPTHDVTGAVQRIIDAVEVPIQLSHALTLSVGASIGVGDGAPRDAMRLADTTLYEAKRRRSHRSRN